MKTFLKLTRIAAITVAVVALLAAAFGAWFYYQMRASLPQLDGTASLPGASAPVTVTRDALGVPTLRAANRADLARALGFLHAQDRFFQMDLLRRRASGELAELFGKPALGIDKETRVHGFRALAHQVFERCTPVEKNLLESYAAGANAGLAALGKKPFEYIALRTEPAPWRAEDSILVIYAMTLDLQDAGNGHERSLTALRDELGDRAIAFFAPLVTPGDAALDGSTAPLPPMPTEREIDLRPAAKSASATPAVFAPLAQFAPLAPDFLPGSNSFAVSGAHTASGAALLANDPHLGLSVPNIWYRAVMEWSDPAPHRTVGVTLPGLPFLVIGSNGHIAWGLTVSYADTADLVTIATNRIDPSLYKIPGHDELIAIEKRTDTIRVKGSDPVTVESSWTAWGPIIAQTAKGLPIANHWVAYDPAATNLNFIQLETAATASEAVAIAHRSGMPAHNFVVADSAGQIAWTIAGTLPKRVGFDGRLPVSWMYGDRRWDGFLPPDEYPTVTTPADGRIWTANNRILGGSALGLLGDFGYAAPSRAAQLRDDLGQLLTNPTAKVAPRDFADIQLDDRAVFLGSWQKILLDALTPAATAEKPARAELARLVAHWEGRASTDSVSYRLVRAFRTRVSELALTPIFASCVEAYPEFNWRGFQYEPALRELLRAKPAHLLNPSYPSWDALLLAAADDVIADLKQQGVPLAAATWGSRNVAHIDHPLGRLLPRWLGGWLNMPADPLAGDVNMPRIQSPTFGASMRLVVAPGHEADGLFQMPGGESGHPLSPFYRAGHEAWVHGQPGPLLPGKTEHTLTLTP
ncbi:MAG: penicillin acylase family protein [Verrucomicrobia bacterium]|nr:penicillin acylase family protein [Verrucomicrobiota bacterium]